MKNKKTKIKIKRSRVNLYNKKKSKTKQVVAIIITAAAACALCILGYGIGKPLMEFFRNRASTVPESSWSPESSDKEQNGADNSDNSAGEQTSSGAGSGEDEPQSGDSNAVYYLSDEAALSLASLSAELAAAKSSGHSAVAVVLKDSEGMFLYKTSIAKVKTKGTLSAAQIAEEIEKAGFVPVAKISTLKDKTNGVTLGCQFKFAGGATWIDNVPGKGITWLSPFDTKTVSFVRSITSELSQAGFKRIIAADTMYPRFYPEDISKNLAHLPLSDREKRAEALWDVIGAAAEGAAAGGAELFVEMDGRSIVLEKKDGTNAEPAYNVDSLKTAGLIINYSPTDSADSAYTTAQTFVENLKKALGGAECAVRITGSYSAAVLEGVKKAFEEAGIEAFSQ